MMLHVLVETNWLVAVASPPHRQLPAARDLLERARRGDFKLHLPALCLVEARKVIINRYSHDADAIRQFVSWAALTAQWPPPNREAILANLEAFERQAGQDFEELPSRLRTLQAEPALEIFALDDAQLSLAADIAFSFDLNPFDQSVLAAVLGKADAILAAEQRAEVVFCELDRDLQPWDKGRNRRADLANLYDAHQVWVYGDFDMEWPPRTRDWPSTLADDSAE